MPLYPPWIGHLTVQLECKSLGGRWDNDARKWYVPKDVDRNLFKQWWPENAGTKSNVFQFK